MNDTTRIAIAVTTAVVGISNSVYHIIKTTKREREKRAKIESEAKEDIEAILYAKQEVLKKINHGDYANKSLTDVKTDFEFEWITYYLK